MPFPIPSCRPVVIVGSARTPIGAFQGDLKDLAAPQLAAPPSAPVSSAPEFPATELLPTHSTKSSSAAFFLPASARLPRVRPLLLQGCPLRPVQSHQQMCGSGMKASCWARSAPRRQRQNHRRRRHGKHEQRPLSPRRAVPAIASATAASSTTCFSMALKTPTTKAADGHIRRRLRPGLRVFTGGAGRIASHPSPRAKATAEGSFPARLFPSP